MAKFDEIKQTRRLVDSSILRMPGVMAVATGYKQVKGKRTDDLAVIIYVAKKLPLDRLPYFHAIPSALEIRGIKVLTDVVEVGYYIPYMYDQWERPAEGGVSIGHLNITAGTLGGLVCGRACEKERNAVLILSNNHVLAATNKGQKGDHIVQPGPADGGLCHKHCIATLERFVPIDFSEDAVNYVDCAVAQPYDSGDVSFKIKDIGYPNLGDTYALTQQDVTKGTKVQKTGRTTQHTVGYVSAIDWKGKILYDWTPAYFEKQIVVETLDGNPVAEGGDSGSLVLTMDNKICGLLFAGPVSGMHYIANHIGEVFNRLDVRLCCAPTEAVDRIDRQEFVPDLRKLRMKLRTDERLRRHLDLYSKHSAKFLEAMFSKPELGKMAGAILEDVGQAIRDRSRKIDKKSAELGLKLIGTISELRKDDEAFLKDMEQAKRILNESAGKTLEEILTMLRK